MNTSTNKCGALKAWELVNFCEFDKYAVKSYCAIHNESEIKNLGDITKVDETKLSTFNMIVGGSPCQDFSVAGKQKGSVWTCDNCGHEYNPLTVHWSKRDKCPHCHSKNIKKTRSSLLVEWLRIIRTNKPNFGVYENVKNIVGKEFKETTFRLFEEELHEYGYNTYWKVLNAKDYRVPQNRERVYLILIKKELDNEKFKFPEPFYNGIRLKDILEDEVDDKFYISDDKVELFLKNLSGVEHKVSTRKSDTASCLRASYYKNGTRNLIENIQNGNGYEGVIEPNVVNQVGNISESSGNWKNPQVGRIDSAEGCAPTLNTCGGGSHEPKILQVGKLSSSQDGIVVDPNGISKTHTAGHNNMPKIICGIDKSLNEPKYIEMPNCLTAREDRGISNRKSEGTAVLETPDYSYRLDANYYKGTTIDQYVEKHRRQLVSNNLRIRKLTPKECFRLMGFSDLDFDNAEKVVSNSQLYKQAGNSIVVDVLYYILIELYKAMPYLFDDLKLGSYFSGIGAFEAALDRLFESINSGNFTQPQVD